MMFEAALIFSEVLLSSYPLLIKFVDSSIVLQTGLRMCIYTVLAACAKFASGLPVVGSNLLSIETLFTGVLNLLHVASSYTAFDKLAAGNAMALFYTYPVWNILFASALFNESIPAKSMRWIGLALVGAILLAQPSVTNWTLVGVLAALTAAITETCIYVWFRSNKDSQKDNEPWTKMMQMYGSSGVVWAIGIAIALFLGVLRKNDFTISNEGLFTIAMFNTFVGFVGYALRFYIIPKVSTVTFSSLSFIGIFAAYVFGWMFTNEKPTIVQGMGAIAIIIANTVLLRREIA